MTRTSLLIASQGVSVYPPTGLQSACRADFIVAQGNALGTEVVVGCALKGHFNLIDRPFRRWQARNGRPG